jgi:hypothetical protein
MSTQFRETKHALIVFVQGSVYVLLLLYKVPGMGNATLLLSSNSDFTVPIYIQQ